MLSLNLITKIGIFGLVLVGGFLMCTNPGHYAYRKYATQSLTTYVKEEVCEDGLDEDQDFLSSSCHTLVDISRPQLEMIIAKKTERQNFLLFSVYETDFPFFPPLSSYRVETIGFLQKFYIYHIEKI